MSSCQASVVGSGAPRGERRYMWRIKQNFCNRRPANPVIIFEKREERSKTINIKL
jgi:hypothetical protein